MNEMKERIITDLALASFLSTIGHKLISINPEGKRLTFSFESSEKLERDILAFYNRSTKVDALSFAETLRNLKALALRS
jgi:hypothetical protein